VIPRVLLTLALTVTVAGASEQTTYEYQIRDGHSRSVCTRMQEVYNRHFEKPHDRRDVSSLVGIKIPAPRDDKLRLRLLVPSFHPSSPEFDAVKWKVKRLLPPSSATYGPRAILVATLDIDNDGSEEIVIKQSFYCGRFGREELMVYERGALDVSQNELKADELWSKTNVPKFVGHGAYVRPFVLDGTTYVHEYEYRRASVKEVEAGLGETPFQAPEYVSVLRYRDSTPGKRGTEIQDLVCKFEMVEK